MPGANAETFPEIMKKVWEGSDGIKRSLLGRVRKGYDPIDCMNNIRMQMVNKAIKTPTSWYYPNDDGDVSIGFLWKDGVFDYEKKPNCTDRLKDAPSLKVKVEPKAEDEARKDQRFTAQQHKNIQKYLTQMLVNMKAGGPEWAPLIQELGKIHTRLLGSVADFPLSNPPTLGQMYKIWKDYNAALLTNASPSLFYSAIKNELKMTQNIKKGGSLSGNNKALNKKAQPMCKGPNDVTFKNPSKKTPQEACPDKPPTTSAGLPAGPPAGPGASSSRTSIKEMQRALLTLGDPVAAKLSEAKVPDDGIWGSKTKEAISLAREKHARLKGHPSKSNAEFNTGVLSGGGGGLRPGQSGKSGPVFYDDFGGGKELYSTDFDSLASLLTWLRKHQKLKIDSQNQKGDYTGVLGKDLILQLMAIISAANKKAEPLEYVKDVHQYAESMNNIFRTLKARQGVSTEAEVIIPLGYFSKASLRPAVTPAAGGGGGGGLAPAGTAKLENLVSRLLKGIESKEYGLDAILRALETDRSLSPAQRSYVEGRLQGRGRPRSGYGGSQRLNPFFISDDGRILKLNALKDAGYEIDTDASFLDIRHAGASVPERLSDTLFGKKDMNRLALLVANLRKAISSAWMEAQDSGGEAVYKKYRMHVNKWMRRFNTISRKLASLGYTGSGSSPGTERKRSQRKRQSPMPPVAEISRYVSSAVAGQKNKYPEANVVFKGNGYDLEGNKAIGRVVRDINDFMIRRVREKQEDRKGNDLWLQSFVRELNLLLPHDGDLNLFTPTKNVYSRINQPKTT